MASCIRKILDKRGEHSGLVPLFSVFEPCQSYNPWHGKRTGRTYLKAASGLCLHYYFYFIDEELGPCYLRVPTYCLFRLQFYFNGHNWLMGQMAKRGIRASRADNVLESCDNWPKAPQIANGFDVRKLQKRLDQYAQRYCPAAKVFKTGHHLSIMQTEYARDIVFTRKESLAPVYESITRTAVRAGERNGDAI